MSITASPLADNPLFPVRPFTVQEYHRLSEVGILTEDDRVELLEGFVVPKMIHNPPHDTSVNLTNEAVRVHLTVEWHTRVQSAVTTQDSEPEPDIAVVRGAIRDYTTRHPASGDIGLLIEVAESSLERDRQKRRLYARAGIVNYWIVNLVDQQVEVFRDPIVGKPEANYRTKHIHRSGETVPLLLDGQGIGDISVSDLLP